MSKSMESEIAHTHIYACAHIDVHAYMYIEEAMASVCAFVLSNAALREWTHCSHCPHNYM